MRLHMLPANRHIESTRVAIKIRETPGQLGKGVKVVWVKQTAFRPTVGRNHGDTTFQRQGQFAQVGEFRSHHRGRVFATGMRKQRQLQLRHAFPELRKVAIVAMDFLAIGQAFDHHRARGDTSIQFFHRIAPGGMNQNCRQKLQAATGKRQDVTVGNLKRTHAIHYSTLCVVNIILS